MRSCFGVSPDPSNLQLIILDITPAHNMGISLLMEPQAKHQRMHRGDSMYSEQSLLELDSIPCKDCKRSFAPKAYVKHFDDVGKPKCQSALTKRRPAFDSARVSYRLLFNARTICVRVLTMFSHFPRMTRHE